MIYMLISLRDHKEEAMNGLDRAREIGAKIQPAPKEDLPDCVFKDSRPWGLSLTLLMILTLAAGMYGGWW